MTTLGRSTDSDCRRTWLLPCVMSAKARGRDGIVAIATLCALLWLMPSPASAQRFPATRKLALADTLYGTPARTRTAGSRTRTRRRWWRGSGRRVPTPVLHWRRCRAARRFSSGCERCALRHRLKCLCRGRRAGAGSPRCAVRRTPWRADTVATGGPARSVCSSTPPRLPAAAQRAPTRSPGSRPPRMGDWSCTGLPRAARRRMWHCAESPRCAAPRRPSMRVSRETWATTALS